MQFLLEVVIHPYRRFFAAKCCDVGADVAELLLYQSGQIASPKFLHIVFHIGHDDVVDEALLFRSNIYKLGKKLNDYTTIRMLVSP